MLGFSAWAPSASTALLALLVAGHLLALALGFALKEGLFPLFR